jgi:opacity protein-like surface antigen
MRSRAAALLCLLLLSDAAVAAERSPRGSVYGYLQTWVTVWQQSEDMKGLIQHPSGHEAVEAVTGFSLRRARIGGAVRIWRGLGIDVQVRLDKPVGLLDFYVEYRVADWFAVQLGQRKVPGTWETMVPSNRLDFATRTAVSAWLADYSLSRTVHASSHFAGNRSYLRDLGLSLTGDVDLRIGTLRYLLTIGNGLGANLFISAAERKEFIIANAPQFFYGARLDLLDLFGVVSLGGHLTWNHHDNMVLNSGRVVLDLERLTGSGDLHLEIPWTGLRLSGMLAWGVIDEDFDADGRGDLAYSGWEARAIWDLSAFVSTMVRAPWLLHHRFELGGRFDRYLARTNQTGPRTRQDDWVLGVSYAFRDRVKIQLNYRWRETRDPGLPDLDDDLLLLSVQAAFGDR